MNNFLSQIAPSLSQGQQNLLRQALQESRSGRAPISASGLQSLIDQAGTLLAPPDGDLTDPLVFNETVTTLLANLAGLYQEIDRLESARDRLHDLNDTELNRIEVALQDLQTLLDRTRQAHAENTQWTDVFHESFGAAVSHETDPSWYQPLPVLAVTGQVEGYLPLVIDPLDHSLKLATGGLFSRSVNALGQSLARVEVEELLGLSLDRDHGIDQALDGKPNSYWRELLFTASRIEADRRTVSWLPTTYSQGAAARVHFRFPFAVPFTEFLLQPFTRYPVQILQQVWDNRELSVLNFLDAAFVSGGALWSGSGPSGTVFQFLSTGGFQDGARCQIQALSGRALLTSARFGFDAQDPPPALHLHFFLQRVETLHPQLFLNWYSSGGYLATEWLPPDTPWGEWYPYSRLFLRPDGALSGEVVLAADGSGTITFSAPVFARTLGAQDLTETLEPGATALISELENAEGTDVWVVIGQPHADYVQLSLPQGDLDQEALWQEIRLAAESADEALVQFQPQQWRAAALPVGRPAPALPEDGSRLVREARRLGGRVKTLVLALLSLARPDPTPRTKNGFLYTLGAWKLAVRHHEYAPQGLFVTTPYHPRGEVRELRLQTDPPLSRLTAPGSPVRFWLTPRAGDRSDKAQLFTGRATFGSVTETPAGSAATHFALAPVARRERASGTDRQGRVPLDFHPYVNRETLWTLQNTLTSGALAVPLPYDPNRQSYLLLDGSTLRRFDGYVPVQVTLTFADGTQAPPDVLGAVRPGDISFAGPEILLSADASQIQSSQGSNAFPQRGPSLTQRQRTQTQTVSQTALQTRFGRILAGINGASFSLYWHNPVTDLVSGGLVTERDVLISPGKYTLDTERGLVILRDSPPSGNMAYSKVVAYYYYRQDESGARQSGDNRATPPTSGVDLSGGLSQPQIATRNVTDYLHGTTPPLRPAVLDDLDPQYYPFYEYRVTERGELLFANVLASFGERPAQITVDYQTLEIEPRLFVEYAPGGINAFSTKTPMLHSFSLFMGGKRV